MEDYEWDYRNRLTKVTEKNSGGTVVETVEFKYDVFDRRIAKIVDADGSGPTVAATTHFVYDGAHVALEFDGSSLTTRFLHGPVIDQVLAAETVPSGTVLWAATDHLGTVRDIVNASGTVVNHITYTSSGEINGQTNPTVKFLFSYAGREFEGLLGLYYNRARYYDAYDGRFIGVDPIKDGVNWYAYVGNGPLTAADPMGLSPAYDRSYKVVNDHHNEQYQKQLQLQERARAQMQPDFVGPRDPDVDEFVRKNGRDPAAWKPPPLPDQNRIREEAATMAALGGPGAFKPKDWTEADEAALSSWLARKFQQSCGTSARAPEPWETDEHFRRNREEYERRLIEEEMYWRSKEAAVALASRGRAPSARPAGGGRSRAHTPSAMPSGSGSSSGKGPSKSAGGLGDDHHLMTNKNRISKAAGGPYTPKFEALAKMRGITLDDMMNRTNLPNHRGPHAEYNKAVYERMQAATDRLSGQKFNDAFDTELAAIKKETCTVGRPSINWPLSKGVAMEPRFFRLNDDLSIPGRWFLDGLADSNGEDVDPRLYRYGLVAEARSGMTVSLQLAGMPLEFTFAAFDMPVLRRDVATMLYNLSPSDIQRIAVNVEGQREEYEILNVISRVECLDQERSEIMWWKEEDDRPDKVGKPRMITKLFVVADHIGSHHIVRPSGWEVVVVVSSAVKAVLEKAHVRGVSFEEV